MGPYCKFCGNRCFVPTNKDDIVKKDLKATCSEGIAFDLENSKQVYNFRVEPPVKYRCNGFQEEMDGYDSRN